MTPPTGKRGKRVTQSALRKAVLGAIPSNWCDPILTGKDSIGEPPYNCKHIERLLLHVTARVTAALDKHVRAARLAGGRR